MVTYLSFLLGRMASPLKFLSWNVKGLNHPVKRRKVFSHIRQFGTAIAFLQETHIRGSDNSRLVSRWAGQHFHSTFQAKARGVSILINHNIPFEHHNVISDTNGRYIIVSGKLYNTMVVLANVYAPNVDDVGFLNGFFSSLPDLSSYSLILGGDFNCWLNPVLDRSSSNPGIMSKSASLIQSFLDNYGVTEIWRYLHPNKREYSFFSHSHQTYSRIDYFFVDNQLVPFTLSCDYQSIVISDHAPVVMSMSLPDLPAAERHWRFNSTLLSNNDFVKFLEEQITFFFDTNVSSETSSLTIWDALKAYLRGQIISFSANMKKRAQKERLELSDQIKEVDRRYAQIRTPELYKKRVELQTRFDLLSTHSAERQLLQSKSLFYVHGDKSGKRLANQLKGFKAKQHITKIQMDDGNITSDPSKINDTFRNFYSRLYTSDLSNDNTLMKNFLDRLELPTLTHDNKTRLDEPISQGEIAAAISSLQSGKSPGPDGFPAEFFKTFSSLLSPYLCSVLSDSFKQDRLPASLYEACICLIVKKGKDPTECSSYRPISLLNVDAKILAKVLARRLEGILPGIISEDQTGFVKKRHSYFNIRRLFDILYSPSEAIPECVLSLDAEKAFDRVEWKYLFAVLEKFGFGPNYIRWVKLLYTCPTASILTNSQRSQPFNLHRGTRQGCPLSPLLFDLTIETLAVALRCCRDISGILRKGIEHKVSLYADDLLLFISNPDTSLPVMLSLLTQFGQVSGYKLNLQKSELFPVNTEALALKYTSLPFKIVENKFVYLGVTVTRKHKCLFKENFSTLLNHVKERLTHWSPLSTSLVGRINSVKMNILPKFLYLFQSVPIFIPKSFFDSLDSIISAYIWRGKRPRLNKVHLQKSKKEGGMALPNFRLYYWAANIRCITFWSHFLDRADCPAWVGMELNSVRNVSILALLGSPLPLPSGKWTDSPTVWHTMRVWAQFRRHFGFYDLSLFSPVRFNPLFQPSLSDSTFQEWHRKGIEKFKDLFIGNTFASFAQLSGKFSLPNTHFFRYLQARHFLRSQMASFPEATTATAADMLLDLHPSRKGLISVIYNELMGIKQTPLDKIKTAWEQDLNFQLSNDVWDSILRLVNSTSLCARHCLLQFKVVHRTHISKARLSRMYSDVDPLCDKCKRGEASLIHMFWTCPSLEKYWRDVFQTLSLILNLELEPNPLVALFGTTGEVDLRLTPSKSRTLSFASLLARRAILLRWRDAAPPTHAQWLRDIMSCLDLEKIRYSVCDLSKKFQKVWGPFLKYFENLKSN